MSNLFQEQTAKRLVVVTFVSLRGILLVEDFSSADMWQYPPPCMNIPIIGRSPTASRSMSGEWVDEPEPNISAIR